MRSARKNDSVCKFDKKYEKNLYTLAKNYAIINQKCRLQFGGTF